MENYQKQAVHITGVDIPMADMVVFMIKWALASIPAAIVLFVLGAFLVGLLGGAK